MTEQSTDSVTEESATLESSVPANVAADAVAQLPNTADEMPPDESQHVQEVLTEQPSQNDPSEMLVFTREEVDAIVVQRIKSAEFTGRSEMQEKLQNQTILIETLQEQNRELLERLNTTQAERKESDAARRIAERDGKLRDALIQAECTDLEIGRRFFVTEMAQDADGDWVLKDGENLKPITVENIAKLLPDSIRASSIKGTGSGSRSTVRSPYRATELDVAKQELERIRHEVRISRGDNTALVKLDSQNRKIQKLEREAAKQKHGKGNW